MPSGFRHRNKMSAIAYLWTIGITILVVLGQNSMPASGCVRYIDIFLGQSDISLL